MMRAFFRGMRAGMKYFGEGVSGIVNALLLTLIYLVGIGTTALIAKCCRKQFLPGSEKHASYWEHLGLKTRKREEYYRQF